MTSEQLAALSEELRTQDNACTAHPLYVVYSKHRIYGLDFDHAEHFCWLSQDKGDGRGETTEDDPGAERVGYMDVDWFETACLTRRAANDFIERNSHRLRQPFVYVESLDRNDEMIAIRKILMEPACST